MYAAASLHIFQGNHSNITQNCEARRYGLSSTLFDYEWQFLIQMTTHINYSGTYPETCNTFLQQIRTLIPYSTGVVFQVVRENGRVSLNSPISTEQHDDRSSHNSFMEGKYPHWNEFVMLSYSSVFRQSDIIAPGNGKRQGSTATSGSQKGCSGGYSFHLFIRTCRLPSSAFNGKNP